MATKPVEHTAPKKITSKEVSTWFSDNWPWAAPAVYIYVTIVGMVQTWFQFKAFGVNIFEFSETNDFLLAAFRDPRSFLGVAGILIYGGLYVSFSKFVNKDRLSILSSRWVKAITFLVIAIAAPFIVLWLLYGHIHFKKEIKQAFIQDTARKMDVMFRMDPENANAKGFEQGWMNGLIFVGTTDKYAFFYQPANNTQNKESHETNTGTATDKPKSKKLSEGAIITPLANVILMKCHLEEKTSQSSQSTLLKNSPGKKGIPSQLAERDQ